MILYASRCWEIETKTWGIVSFICESRIMTGVRLFAKNSMYDMLMVFLHLQVWMT